MSCAKKAEALLARPVHTQSVVIPTFTNIHVHLRELINWALTCIYVYIKVVVQHRGVRMPCLCCASRVARLVLPLPGLSILQERPGSGQASPQVPTPEALLKEKGFVLN